MKSIKSNKWCKSNIPKFKSERVKIKYSNDGSLGRYSTHYLNILIDNEVVCCESWLVDDDWDNCSDEEPIAIEVWNKWVETLNQ